MLEGGVLEDGLDDRVAAREVGGLGGGGDAGEEGVGLLLAVRPRETALAHSFSEYSLPLAADSAETSLRTTSMPARAQE